MTTVSHGEAQPPVADPFAHLGLFYRGAEEYLAGVMPFVQTGLDTGEPVLIAVPGANLELVRECLGGDAERVRLRDMALAGRNPGRIIPALLAFLAEHLGHRVRIVGEPIWPGRTVAEYSVCVQNEALINLALAERPAILLCPYDADRLDPQVLTDAEGTHPVLVDAGRRLLSPGYVDPAHVVAAFNRPLLEPEEPLVSMEFTVDRLSALRQLVAEEGKRVGLSVERVLDLQLAVNEVATNTIDHASGHGTLRIWREPGQLVCEVRDSGHITDLLAGRIPPSNDLDHGRGLLLVHHLCDLVTIYTADHETTMRMYMNSPDGRKRSAGAETVVS